MVYLRQLKKNGARVRNDGYPFSTRVVAALDSLNFTRPVTILSGGNGSGKTTLLDIIAEKTGAQRISAGRPRQTTDGDLAAFAAVFSQKPSRAFYFSAEDFLSYIRQMEAMKRDAGEAIDEIKEAYRGRSVFAINQAMSPHGNTLHALNTLYDRDLARSSHGEGFLAFFGSRLRPGGLYILDEPESALTYENQYALGIMMLNAVKEECQFIVGTHSPVLCALPGADILAITEGELVPTRYDDLCDISFLRLFLSGPARFFRG